MLTCISNLLTREETARLCDIAAHAEFDPGTLSAGRRIESLKTNLQIKADAPGKDEADKIVVGAMQRNALFQSVAMPKAIHQPTLNIYRDGMYYDSHVDAAMMSGMRADISITVFLKDPTSYDGGELTIETGAGEQAIKLMAGDAVVYPTSAFHRVTPVTRGERLAAITWVQSAVPNVEDRTILHNLRTAIDLLGKSSADPAAIQLLVKTHTNLLRRWIEM